MRVAAVMLAMSAACASSNGGVAADDGGVDDPDAEPGSGDGFPTGAISFFLDTSCPAGWDLFADGVGRTIVPVAGDDAGATIGDALAGNEQRAHGHDLQVSVSLPSVSYAGIAGEANHGVARGGAVEAVTRVADASATPPYAQLLICEKVSPSGNRTAPSGVIAFFAAEACPAPWTEVESLRGRFMVSVPAGGIAGSTFGGAPLSPGEVRGHGHDVAATVTTSSHGIALAGGCCADGYGATGAHGATALAAPAGIEVPYVQLLACAAP